MKLTSKRVLNNALKPKRHRQSRMPPPKDKSKPSYLVHPTPQRLCKFCGRRHVLEVGISAPHLARSVTAVEEKDTLQSNVVRSIKMIRELPIW